jgi:hypothetical protein
MVTGVKVPQLLAMFDLLLTFLFAIQLSKLLRNLFYFSNVEIACFFLQNVVHVSFCFLKKNMIHGLVS